MAERERIARYFAPLSHAEPGSFALTDDAAVLTPPTGYSLVFTTDSVIESVHVLADATPQQFAQKLVRRNLSDLAAMGATPWRYMLNIHTPRALPEPWFAAFSAALASEQNQFGMALIGGDSTSGGDNIHATLTCIGLLNTSPLLRSGASVGDDIYVSGTLGDAALGLALLQQNITMDHTDHATFLTSRYHIPQPRLALGLALHSIATSCIDISDGLLADAQQIASASAVGITIERDAIPVSDATQSLTKIYPNVWEIICTGGDDYELLFTAPPSKRADIAALSQQLSLPITRIGNVTASNEVQLIDAQKQPIIFNDNGWEH
jgi:thiamine-monophosphate kinase